MNKKIKKVIIISSFIIIILNLMGKRGTVVEELDIPNAVGVDFQRMHKDEGIYNISVRTYFSESKFQNDSKVLEGEAINIGETRDQRQLKASKKYILGLEKVVVVGEEQAIYGIGTSMDILIYNPEINDNAKVVVCKGKAKDILEYEAQKYGAADEYIGDLVERLQEFNFFIEDYTIMDCIIKSSSEGRNIVLPYIELTKKGIEVTGLAIFDKDKMVKKLNIEDTRILNLLRENNAKGNLTIQENYEKYINYYAKSKRKVKCYKEGENYRFIIELNLKGPIVSNELYENLNNDSKVLKQFTHDMEKHVEKICMDFIEKIQSSPNIDMLELGKVAAAKYGRGKGIDWNKEVMNSKIQVKVNVKVDSQGRGDY